MRYILTIITENKVVVEAKNLFDATNIGREMIKKSKASECGIEQINCFNCMYDGLEICDVCDKMERFELLEFPINSPEFEAFKKNLQKISDSHE